MTTEPRTTPTRRAFEVTADIPGTPEQIWQAIATGPGITLWFTQLEVEEHVGGAVRSPFNPDHPGRVTIWEPPHRFAYQFDEAHGPHAWEFIIETQDGGKCTVRLVDSFYVTNSEWSEEVTTGPDGWRWAFDFLRANQQYFPGQPGVSVQAMAMAPGTFQEAWAIMRQQLGLPALQPGADVTTSGADVPHLAGNVVSVDERIVTILLSEPTTGLAWLATGGASEAQAHVMVHINLFGPDAEAVAAREQPLWQAWLARAFPMPEGHA
ncbi:MAG: SRPBCC domain-containing protein [Chloroflexota bacterium]